MNSFILYLFETSLVLLVLYGLYRLLLSKETFFSFNRFYLMTILVLALLLPLVSIDFTPTADSLMGSQSAELGQVRFNYHSTFENWSEGQVGTPEVNGSWWQQFWIKYGSWQSFTSLILLIYLLGFAYRLFRLSLAYLKIYQLKGSVKLSSVNGVKVAHVPAPVAPFSFIDTVFIPDDIEDENEYEQILAHEKTHIREKHSIDLIFVQLVVAFLWFNPVVWLLLKSLKQTHEYIADKRMIQQGYSIVAYQSLLLKQLISNQSFGLAHNFNLSFIKKRIAMMNSKKSGWTGWVKLFTALCFVLLTAILTAQSNKKALRTVAADDEEETLNSREIQFYVDGIALSKGLRFSQLSDYNGEFKFVLDNGQTDQIKIGLDLLREGTLVGHANSELTENVALSIKELLSQALVNDYLVVDIMEGPSEVVKLYNIPLFREGKGWKKQQSSDLPPAPPRQVSVTVNGEAVNSSKGLSLAEYMAAGKMEGLLRYELSEFVDMDVLEKQGAEVEIVLMRKEFRVRVMEAGRVKRKATIELLGFLGAAEKGDEVLVLFGNPDGLRFGEKFSLE